ncbi:hypothetical protein ASG87_02110 [Frateuria sp. Soil773]|uniref:hypothetical protein n=1 Tax=Frateuria sp. Soil773 TaxID=1736407 RepID=UPI0007005C67|nr:hypothetical protein [Frateuria sp. Soil773]KRE90950.1 hypothetical protein ASG87_02110 [Frateuria sp. Soil773]
MKTLLAAAVLLFAPIAAHAGCAATDFAVQDFKVGAGSGAGARMSMKGALVNHCTEAAAAQIQIEAKDSSGKVVQTKKGWPAGTTNIAPGQSVDFDMGRLFRFQSDMQTYTVSVVDVRAW